MMKKYFFIGIAALALSSCNIYRTINFNEDHSGHIENKIDMSSMMSLLNENGGNGMGSMGGMEDMKQMDLTKKQLEAIAGITNVNVNFDSTGIIYTSYDFSGTDALQNSMGSAGNSTTMMMGMGTQNEETPRLKITYKGKKFYFEEMNKKALQKMESQTNPKEMEQMDMILNSSTIYTTLTFPSDVKKVSYKNAAITNNRTVSYNMSLKQLLSKDYKPLTIMVK